MRASTAVSSGLEHRRASRIERVPDDTLVPLLKAQAVPMETLHERYGPLLELVRVLIGVVPNCDPYLEIWPPAFRTYNILVPNFLDLPLSLFGMGKAPADVVGLGMYVASRAAECPYCSAHTCSFALRRGAAVETIARALDRDAPLSAPEKAIVAVARSLARVPCELIPEEREALRSSFGADAVERIVTGVVMMGFLNKLMDAIGVELEVSTVAEVTEVMGEGWSAGKADTDLPDDLATTAPPSADSRWSLLRIVPLFPKALMLDSNWQKGVPDRWPATGEFLERQIGHAFPVLSRIRNRRVIRAVASMLRENLNAETTGVGLDLKVLAGVVFATVVADEALAEDVRALASRHGVTVGALDAARAFAADDSAPPPGDSARARALLDLARAASPSPARITPAIVGALRDVAVEPAAIVELVTWISVLQMLHRLTSFFPA